MQTPPCLPPVTPLPLANRIEVEGGPELPVLDGSAEGWTEQICAAGLRFASERADRPVQLPPEAREEQMAAGEGEEGAAEGEEEGEGLGPRGQLDDGLPRPPVGAVPKLVLRPHSVGGCRGGRSDLGGRLGTEREAGDGDSRVGAFLAAQSS